MKHLKAFGYIAAAEILSLFIGLTLATSSSIAFRLISALCTTGILICFMANFALTSASNDRRNERVNNEKINPLAPVTTGITASLPALISWIALFISHKTGGFDFYKWHKLLNAYFLQIYNFINPDASTAALTDAQVMAMLGLVFIPCVSFISVYFMVYKGIIPEQKN